ncbi:MAG: class I SAM-dependent methyltransferase [Bacteroidetes bacterium]|nr:class I SAM-dependent methyltransferase [Bacteroidota bacterium]
MLAKELFVMKQRELVPCAACGSDNYALYPVHLNPWLPQNYTYSKCNECDFVYVNPRPLPEEVEEIYAAHTNPFDQEEYEGLDVEGETLERLVHRLKREMPEGHMLDMGCGRGDFLKVAHNHGYTVQGSDLSTADGPHKDIPIFQGFLKDANFHAEEFDIIVTRNTLEHIFDPNEDLRELNRILKPGGLLYVKVPHVKYEEGWRCKAFFGFKSLFTPPVHLNHFSTSTLSGILNRNGFEVISWESEKPSKSKNKLKNAVLETGYAAIDTMKAVTMGKAFPKPVLCVLVRKIGVPTYSVTLDLPLREPIHPVSTDAVTKLRKDVKKRQLTA